MKYTLEQFLMPGMTPGATKGSVEKIEVNTDERTINMRGPRVPRVKVCFQPRPAQVVAQYRKATGRMPTGVKLLW